MAYQTDYSLTYNVILGRPTLNKLKVSTSTYHLKVKFPTAYGIEEIQGDQVLVGECYQATLASGENHTLTIEEPKSIFEPPEASQDIKIILGYPSKVLKVGLGLSASEKMKIITLLRENQDVFAWKYEDMPRIDKEIIQHCLNVNPKCKQVQ